MYLVIQIHMCQSRVEIKAYVCDIISGKWSRKWKVCFLPTNSPHVVLMKKTAGNLVSLALALFSGVCSVSVRPRIAKIELIYEWILHLELTYLLLNPGRSLHCLVDAKSGRGKRSGTLEVRHVLHINSMTAICHDRLAMMHNYRAKNPCLNDAEESAVRVITTYRNLAKRSMI